MNHYRIDIQKMIRELDGSPRFIVLKGTFTEGQVEELANHPRYNEVDVWSYAKKVNAMDEIARLIGEYRIPAPILRDVQQRIGDWKTSELYIDDDMYLWQQVRYLKNYLRTTGKEE